MRSTVLLFLTGLSLAIAPMPVAFAQPRPAHVQAASDPYAAHIAEASQRFGIPATWIRAVLRAESAGDRRAVSTAGAIGLMQVMPATWADLRVRHRLGSDPFDPRDNILAGTAYLRAMYDRYGSVAAMLAAYNAGPGRYEASLSGRPLPTETIAYVAALGPVFGIEGDAAPLVIPAVDPLAWTRAPLFAARPASKPTVDPVPPEQEKGGGPGAVALRDGAVVGPRSDGLFVTRSGGGDVR